MVNVVVIIEIAIFIGIVLCIIPDTRKVGFILVGGALGLVMIISGLALFLEVFVISLPILILFGIGYAIYRIGVMRGKAKKVEPVSSSESEIASCVNETCNRNEDVSNNMKEKVGEMRQRIRAICPYCNKSININSQSEQKCKLCDETFVYRGGGIYKNEDVCSDLEIYIIILLAKLAKADGVVTNREIELLDNLLDNVLQLNYSQKKEVQEVFNIEKKEFRDYEKYMYPIYSLNSSNKKILIKILDLMLEFSHEDGEFTLNRRVL